MHLSYARGNELLICLGKTLDKLCTQQFVVAVRFKLELISLFNFGSG